jgi:hypothetical protein
MDSLKDVSVTIILISVVGIFTNDELMNECNKPHLLLVKNTLELIIGGIFIN